MSVPINWHKFDVATFDIGGDEIQVDEKHVFGVYSAPCSILDAFRLRHEVGLGTANEALRR